MPPRQLRDYSKEEIQQIMLEQLYEHPEGLTMQELLDAVSPDWMLEDWDAVYLVLLDMRLANQVRLRYMTGKPAATYRFTASGWLMWAKARQEEDAIQAPARL